MIVCEEILSTTTQTRERNTQDKTILEKRVLTQGIDWIETSQWIPVSVEEK